MAGRFEGLTDAEWELFRNIVRSEERRGRGRPAAPSRNVLNSLLHVLIVGCRCCDIPRGPRWASKSSSRRRLKSWHDDGTLKEIKARLLGRAQNDGLICRNSGASDGSFPSGKRGGAEAAYGYEGKGVLINLLVDADGMPPAACSAPANEDEGKHVGPLLEMVAARQESRGGRRRKPRRIAADKGYDSDPLRDLLEKQGHSAAHSNKEERRQETGTANQHERSAIPSRTDFFMAAKKVPAACRPMGKTANMF